MSRLNLDGGNIRDMSIDDGMAQPPIIVTAALSLTRALHGGKTLLVSIAAGIALTLPPAIGSGVKFRYVCGVTVTSVNNIIKVTTTDIMIGSLLTLQDAADTVVGWEAAATSDTITMNGTTKGGLVGDWIDLEDIAPAKWQVTGVLKATGTEVTPFSAAQS